MKREKDETIALPPREQFGAYVEAMIEEDKKAREAVPVPSNGAPKVHRDIAILATSFQHAAEWWKDLERTAERPAIRWLAKGHREELEFVAARIRELLDPTVDIKPEIAASAIEATYQANLSVLRVMGGGGNGKDNGNGDGSGSGSSTGRDPIPTPIPAP